MGISTTAAIAPAKLTLTEEFYDFYQQLNQLDELDVTAYLLSSYTDIEDIKKENFNLDLKNWKYSGIKKFNNIFSEAFSKNNKRVYVFNDNQYAAGGSVSIIAISKDLKTLIKFKEDFGFNKSINKIEKNVAITQTC